jgi:hypothetical protein
MEPKLGDIKNGRRLKAIIPDLTGNGSEWAYIWEPLPSGKARFMAGLRYCLNVLSYTLQSLCILTAFSFLLMICGVGILTVIEHRLGPDVLPAAFRIIGAAALLGIALRTGISRARDTQ